MDGTMDGTTDRCKPVYPPLFQSGGIIILSHKALVLCILNEFGTIFFVEEIFYFYYMNFTGCHNISGIYTSYKIWV